MEMEQTKVKMQLAARIGDLVDAKGWNKSQFAGKAGKHPSEITKWLSGTQNFTVDVLTEIACTLGVEVTELFGKEQVHVIYRQAITVRSAAPRQTIVPATPMSSADTGIHEGHYMLTRRENTSPFTHYCQA